MGFYIIPQHLLNNMNVHSTLPFNSDLDFIYRMSSQQPFFSAQYWKI